MYAYRPPLNEMHFVLHDLLNVEAELKAIGLKDVTRDMFDGILEAIGTFATEKVAPTNAPGDRFGVRLENGQVTTAPGFRDCYRQLGADGWIGMNIDERYGGQGCPISPISASMKSSCRRISPGACARGSRKGPCSRWSSTGARTSRIASFRASQAGSGRDDVPHGAACGLGPRLVAHARSPPA